MYLYPLTHIQTGNERFVGMTDLTTDQIAESLTIFNLVKAEFIPRLFVLFALALRGGSPPPLILQQSPLAPNNMQQDSRAYTNSRHVADAQGGTSGTDSHYSNESASSTESGRNADIDENSSSSSSHSASTVVSSSGAENDDDSKEEEECLHVSMDVPCVPFLPKDTPIFMTITLMNDIDPSKRCFHCVFGANPHAIVEAGEAGMVEIARNETPSSLGKIRRISYASLATLL